MQEAIQPKYYQAKVKCNCGNEFTIGSTQEEILSLIHISEPTRP